MKTLNLFITLSIVCLISIISCKSTSNSNSNKTEKEGDIVKSTYQKNKESDTAVVSLNKYSLDQLLKLYSDVTQPKEKSVTNKYNKAQILTSIISKHEISSDLYAQYRDDFWNRKTSYIHTINCAELNTLLKGIEPTDYVMFTFTEKKVAYDFNYKIAKTHSFKSFVSCFPAILLKQMTENNCEKITIGKGLKYIDNPPYSLPKGYYNIAMLKFFDSKGNVQYFDIVEDPSLSKK